MKLEGKVSFARGPFRGEGSGKGDLKLWRHVGRAGDKKGRGL